MHLIDFTLKSITFLCLLFLLPAVSQSQDLSSAKIKSIEGSVQFTRPTTDGAMNRVKLRENDGLLPGDVVKTNSTGRVVLSLTDGSQAIISANTTVEIKDLNSSPRTIFNVLRGKTRIKIEKLGGRPNPYRVTTPTTVIAVRGTMFDVFVKDNKTEVFVSEGEVSVINFLLPTEEVILAPGQFTRVEQALPPQAPSQFRHQQNDEHFRPRESNRNEHDSPRREDDDDDQHNPGQRNSPRDRGGEPRPDNFPGNTDRDNPRGTRPHDKK